MSCGKLISLILANSPLSFVIVITSASSTTCRAVIIVFEFPSKNAVPISGSPSLEMTTTGLTELVNLSAIDVNPLTMKLYEP